MKRDSGDSVGFDKDNKGLRSRECYMSEMKGYVYNISVTNRIGLDFDCFKADKLTLRSVDWYLEAAKWSFDGLKDVGAITKSFGNNVGSIPFALEFC